MTDATTGRRGRQVNGGAPDPAFAPAPAAGTFPRGVQPTDAGAAAELLTVDPGWYAGRTLHIHVKVSTEGTPEILDAATPAGTARGDAGGHVAHTGQIFFDDAVSDEVYAAVAACAGRDDAQRPRHEDDGIPTTSTSRGSGPRWSRAATTPWPPATSTRSRSASTPPPRRSRPAARAGQGDRAARLPAASGGPSGG